jgi:hypothetical protein
MVVVLPAPLTPRKPMISPAWTSKLMPCKRSTRPYDLCRSSTSTTAGMVRPYATRATGRSKSRAALDTRADIVTLRNSLFPIQ